VNLAEVLHRLGQNARAQTTIRRVNAQPEVANAQTLWLAARIERALGNIGAANEFGAQLRSKYPDAPETELFAQGRFGD
jgi:type IV pilus assembly protein PilF